MPVCVVSIVTFLQHQLSVSCKEVTALKAQIKQRNELLTKLHSNSTAASLESTKSLKVSTKLKVAAEDHTDMPSVRSWELEEGPPTLPISGLT
jgi:hypothetical protein